jgi:hypothetical protein
VNEGADLLHMLVRIRRRARSLSALEGAVAGVAGVLCVATIVAVIARARGSALPWRAALAAASAAAVVGAGISALRRIPLVRCARWLDAAIDRDGSRDGSRGGSRAHDRVLSALTFVEGPDARAAFIRAAIADAVARARTFGPAVVRPARRPTALPALAVAGLALAVVAAWPARAPAARYVSRRSSPPAPTSTLRVPADALDAEREELRALDEAADATGDVEMRAAAREARVALDALTDGALDRGDVLDRLTTLATRTREAAEQSSDEQAALHAAGKTLEATAATRALGRALGADAAGEAAHALRDLADRAASSDAARADAARALAAAASATTSGGDDADAKGADGRRRLARDEPAGGGHPNAPAAGAEARARHLERLRRDLDDAANACRDDAATCAARLRDQTNDVPRLAREAAQASARRRLETTVEHLRERLRRGDLDRATRDPSERRFARAASGDGKGRPSAQEEAITDRRGGARPDQAGGAPSMASADGDDDVFSSEPEASGEAAGDGKGGAAPTGGGETGALAQGQGYGHENGGDPLGRGATPPARGRAREAEVQVRDGAGPVRSEVIEASARRGFAARDYVRVFEDYQPVVEESLATNAVPDGRRYVVRRYFQLIRPRAP